MNRFDVMGTDYEESLKRFPDVRKGDLDALLQRANLRPNLNVIDFTAGSGFITLPVARKIGASGSVLAIDISEVMLEQLKTNALVENLKNIDFLKTDNPMLPDIPLESWDLIVSLGGFHHVEQQIEICRSFHRLLKPGGYAIIMDFEDGTPIQRHFDSTVHKYTQTGHEGMFLSYSRAENLCRFSGFDTFSIERIEVAWYFNDVNEMGEYFRIMHSLSISSQEVRDLTLDLFQPQILNDGSLNIIMNFIVLKLEI